MADLTRIARIATDEVDLAGVLASVDDPGHGAVASFVGQVRDHDPEAGGRVVALRYTCHPDAPRLVVEIVERVLRDLDPQGEASVHAVHRVGDLEVGDLALVVAVGTAHRDLAFTICRALVEAVKHELPVWKQQFEADGTHAWSGLSC
ncbi:molybdenum cofactor biosynthesis protein MoaE [Janibacter terrae]|jgi:molybdopterin synthase catalytic subunit|uniref:Molybdenum cofactor biosynthesis protein MoaE n=1 Tax=Janibacter terrae TaxID=103817 RepID=A0ABZ2FD77_9MICO|nr:molybdenum cofactor biosynthesis protein MoaE [Janibacter terrae]HBO54289.1 molybdenum cofactor biosynthesis protein MoaE [Janibacter terrae]